MGLGTSQGYFLFIFPLKSSQIISKSSQNHFKSSRNQTQIIKKVLKDQYLLDRI